MKNSPVAFHVKMCPVKYFVFILIIVASILNAGLCQNSNSFDRTEEDLTLTYREKLAFDKFKARAIPIVPHDYMREDIYLINWLRAKDFDVDQAEQFLKQNLKWRKDLGMDDIHSEDFSDIVEEYPAYVDTVDKRGAPVITAMAGNWDIRRAILTGGSKRLHRFIYKIIDEAAISLRKSQLAGKHITRFHFLLNLEGFNLVQHGCPRCVIGIIDLIQHYENYYPGMIDKVVLFNAPPALQAIRPVIRAAISGRTRSRITIIGTDKPEWQNFLWKFIDMDQLTEEFGGTRHRHNE